MLSTNFGSLCPKVTNFGSQNFGYQIWFCTRLLKACLWSTSHQHCTLGNGSHHSRGLYFTKRTNVSLQDLAKSQSHEIGCYNDQGLCYRVPYRKLPYRKILKKMKEGLGNLYMSSPSLIYFGIVYNKFSQFHGAGTWNHTNLTERLMIVSLWNFTGILAALLLRCLSNFRVIGNSKPESWGFKTLQHLAVRRPSAQWIETLVSVWWLHGFSVTLSITEAPSHTYG